MTNLLSSSSYLININSTKYSDFRKHLHSIPEVKYEEKETKAFILNKIKSFKNFNKLIIKEIGDTGFFVDLKGEKETNKIINEDDEIGIAFRTELDALPIKETTKVDYISKHEGKSHACGHDGHMTILTCLLEYLLYRVSLLPKNMFIRFIYQPAEEGGLGAKKMIEGGCLKYIKEIYGLHNGTLYEVGKIGIKSGPTLASCDLLEINISGKGGHGSAPHLTNNPISTGIEIIQKINQITSQNIDSTLRSVVSITAFNSGSTCNVIPNQATILGSIRTFSNLAENQIKEKISYICEKIAKLNSCEVVVNIRNTGIVTYNDEKLVNEVCIPALQRSKFDWVIGEESMFSEDFSYYQKEIPGVFVNIGCKDENHNAFNHTGDYNYNDLTTPYGVEYFVRIVEEKAGVNLI